MTYVKGDPTFGIFVISSNPWLIPLQSTATPEVSQGRATLNTRLLIDKGPGALSLPQNWCVGIIRDDQIGNSIHGGEHDQTDTGVAIYRIVRRQ